MLMLLEQSPSRESGYRSPMDVELHHLDLIKNTFLIGHLRHNVLSKLRITYIDTVGASFDHPLITVSLIYIK